MPLELWRASSLQQGKRKISLFFYPISLYGRKRCFRLLIVFSHFNRTLPYLDDQYFCLLFPYPL